MLTVNNNVQISGKYKLLWWQQQEFSKFKKFLSRIGFDDEIVWRNQNLTNLEVDDSSTSVILKFGMDWDRLNFAEIVNPGQIVDEEIIKTGIDSTNTGFSSVWYSGSLQTTFYKMSHL